MTRLEKLAGTLFSLGILTMVAAFPTTVFLKARHGGWDQSISAVGDMLMGIGGLIAIVAGALMIVNVWRN